MTCEEGVFSEVLPGVLSSPGVNPSLLIKYPPTDTPRNNIMTINNKYLINTICDGKNFIIIYITHNI